jgi:hypothetical protein
MSKDIIERKKINFKKNTIEEKTQVNMVSLDQLTTHDKRSR